MLVTFLILSAAVGAVAQTITRTHITKHFRLWVSSRSQWAGALVSCPYCLAHWLALGATLLYRDDLELVNLWLPLDLAAVTMAMAGTAMVIPLLVGHALEAPAMSLPRHE